MSETTAAEFIRRCADVATATGVLAGVGAMELAGQIVSVLAANPEHIERFMAEGGELFIDGTLDPKNGSLTYLAINGNITSPSVLRDQKNMTQ